MLLKYKWVPTEFQGKKSLKIDQKVACNIASEASYVYILSGQKFISAKKWSILAIF